MSRFALIIFIALSALACENQESKTLTRLDLNAEAQQPGQLVFQIIEEFAPPEYVPPGWLVIRDAKAFQVQFAAAVPVGVDFDQEFLLWSGEGQLKRVEAQVNGLSLEFSKGAPSLARVRRVDVQSLYSTLSDFAARLFDHARG